MDTSFDFCKLSRQVLSGNLNLSTDQRILFCHSEWYPIVNYDPKSQTTIYLERNTSGTPAGIDLINEAKIFDGRDNPVVLTKTDITSFHCTLTLLYYPFDRQECYIRVCEQFHFNQKAVKKSLTLLLGQSTSVYRFCRYYIGICRFIGIV